MGDRVPARGSHPCLARDEHLFSKSSATKTSRDIDRHHVPYVERLARHGVTSGIQQEALRILPILYERRRREQESSRLVRAADAPLGPQQTLLRPYDSAGESDPQVLVRAIGAESTEE